jgi:hypothetical protein
VAKADWAKINRENIKIIFFIGKITFRTKI